MAVRLEIGWHPDLTDAEGEGVRRQAREYFGLDLTAVRVLRVLMLDLDLPPGTLEAIRTEIFTHPTTQISGFAPLAQDFQWAIWVGFKPGVRDTAGAVAREAIAAYLGRPLPPGAAVYTSKLLLFTGEDLTERPDGPARPGTPGQRYGPGIPDILAPDWDQATAWGLFCPGWNWPTPRRWRSLTSPRRRSSGN